MIIPKRHIGSFFETTRDEQLAILALLDKARLSVQETHEPDAFNIGINDGPAAGQTVPHLYVHSIPRFVGDIQDPRGGARWFLPNKANYWSGQ